MRAEAKRCSRSKREFLFWRSKTPGCLELRQGNVLCGQAANAAAPLLRPILLVSPPFFNGLIIQLSPRETLRDQELVRKAPGLLEDFRAINLSGLVLVILPNFPCFAG